MYVVYKDYLTGRDSIGYRYETIEAESEFDAVSQAEKMWNEESEKLYLMRIMKKVGKILKHEDGWKSQRYEATLCKRSVRGWHNNTESEYEEAHFVDRWYKKNLDIRNWEFFETIRV